MEPNSNNTQANGPGCRGGPNKNFAVTASLRHTELPPALDRREGSFNAWTNASPSTLETNIGKCPSDIRKMVPLGDSGVSTKLPPSNYSQVPKVAGRGTKRALDNVYGGTGRPHLGTSDVHTDTGLSPSKRQALQHFADKAILSLPQAAVVAPKADRQSAAALHTYNAYTALATAEMPNQTSLSTEMRKLIEFGIPINSMLLESEHQLHEQQHGGKATGTSPPAVLLNSGHRASGGVVLGSNGTFSGAAAAVNNTHARSLELREGWHRDPPEENKAKEALCHRLFQEELQVLYRRCMLAAGFTPQDTSHKSQHFRRFAFYAWKNECERLQKMLGGTHTEKLA